MKKIRDLLLADLHNPQLNARECLEILRKRLRDSQISGFDFVMSELAEIVRANPEILYSIVKQGLYKAFDIDKQTLSALELQKLRALVLKFAIEHSNEALLEMLMQDKDLESRSEYESIIAALLKLACARTDVQLLARIYEENPSYFSTPDNIPGLSDFDKKFIALCMQHRFPERFGMMIDYNTITENANYESMLLACAAIKSKKPWFDTVVLNCNESADELRDLCLVIQENPNLFEGKPVSFIMSGKHWVSGTIIVTEGSMQILLVDPLGKESFVSGVQFPYKTDSPWTVLGKIFPESAITIPENKLQHANYACWIFALDAVRKLQKIDAIPTRLPLSILRNTQSIKAIDKYAESSEYINEVELPLNKKGQTFTESTREHYETTLNSRAGQNKRVEHKFSMLKLKVWDYLTNFSDEQIKEDMHAFSLSAFIARNNKLKIKNSIQ